MERLRLPEGEPIEARMVTRSIESAQRKVEARNFDIRKQLLQYDDVANDQRKVIYAQRNEVLESADITDTISSLREAAVSRLFREYVPQDTMEEQWDIPGLTTALQSTFQIELPLAEMLEKESNLTDDDLHDRVIDESQRLLQAKIDMVGQPNWGNFERSVLLQSIDTQWRGHLQALDHLRQG
ncbi:preprotein translocase subunit SecA, partial [Providencia rettgeri]|nr:preprotein translocase subunit SecA [Providencia rettgeri]